jgi:DNA-directed RNA polymerase specialized sigma24 family protein
MTQNQDKNRKDALLKAHNDYEKGLGSYAFFKLNDIAISEDLVQDTFSIILLWMNIGKINRFH